jgi:hypothetical protein
MLETMIYGQEPTFKELIEELKELRERFRGQDGK